MRSKEVDAGLVGDSLQLLDRSRPIDVARHEQHFLLPGEKQSGELAAGGGLARALERTASMKCFTTGSATSASSSATRTSRSASWMFASVRRASPRICFTILARRAVRLSSMG